MLFRNLTLFRFAPTALSIDTLQRAMEMQRLRAIGPLEASVSGFVAPYRADDVGEQDLVYATAGSPYLISVGVAEKILPAQVVEEHLDKKVKALAESQGRPIGARERKRLKEEVLTDLLPKAFARRKTIHAYIDVADGWLVVDTASRKNAEHVGTLLRQALGSFPATPCAPDESPRALLTSWLMGANRPSEFALGDECELRIPADGGGKWVGRNVDLESAEVREHLQGGMQAYRVGVVFGDRLTCSLGEDMSVRKFKLLDGAGEKSTAETQAEEFAAEYVRCTLEIRGLLDSLVRVFAIRSPKVDAEATERKAA